MEDDLHDIADIAIIQTAVDTVIDRYREGNEQIGGDFQVPINLWRNWWKSVSGNYPKHLMCTGWSSIILNELGRKRAELHYYTHPKWMATGPWDGLGSPWLGWDGEGADGLGDYEMTFSLMGHSWARFYNLSTNEYVEADIWKRGRTLRFGNDPPPQAAQGPG